jgi:hypothetical protein
MYQLGIFTGVELKSKSVEFGETFWKIRVLPITTGIHNSEVEPNY